MVPIDIKQFQDSHTIGISVSYFYEQKKFKNIKYPGQLTFYKLKNRFRENNFSQISLTGAYLQ